MSKISIIGAGNVAHNVCAALDKAGHTILQVVSKNEASAKELASKYGAYFGDNHSTWYGDNADFILISVPDDQSELALTLIPQKTTAIVMHTSGSLPLDILTSRFANTGVFYPLQSFNKDKLIDFLDVPLLIEGNNTKNEIAIFDLADSISNQVKKCYSDDRSKYHLAAVFANNFTNAMYTAAAAYLESAKLDFKVLLPIIQHTAQRVKISSPVDVQTGPARRGDANIIERHLSMLTGKEKEIYSLISEYIGAQASLK